MGSKEGDMKRQGGLIDMIKRLDASSILKLYNIARMLTTAKQLHPNKATKINIENIRQSQEILSSIKDSFSADIELLEREERC